MESGRLQTGLAFRVCWTLVLAALLLATGCGGDGGSPSQNDGGTPVHHAVSVNDGNYYPRNITIAQGDSVTWTWSVNDDHSVTSGTTPDPSEDPRAFDSGVRAFGSFGHRFAQQGSFTYFCRKHWDMGMTGQVTVGTP